jgi:hydroxyacylglutathione hydrolase
MKTLNIFPIPALTDNYIWLITHALTHQTIIIDPSDATPVFKACQQYKLFNIPIYASSAIDDLPIQLVFDHQTLSLFHDIPIQVLTLPGHTQNHVAYLIGNNLFCGDILFPGACGKVEGHGYQKMYTSLQKIAQLPKNTLLYPGHEYTVQTLLFAQHIDPNNRYIQTRLDRAKTQRAHAQSTLPVQLADELKTNPFLRCTTPTIQRAVESLTSQRLTSAQAVFTALREWKNQH